MGETAAGRLGQGQHGLLPVSTCMEAAPVGLLWQQPASRTDGRLAGVGGLSWLWLARWWVVVGATSGGGALAGHNQAAWLGVSSQSAADRRAARGAGLVWRWPTRW